MVKSMKISLVTPSYGPDFERCKILCESVDKFVNNYNQHLIIVDHKDYQQFKTLRSKKTEIIIKEDYLPGWLSKVPLSKKWWFSLKTLPVRGWILQQIIKLSMAEISSDELFLFVDSDVAFIRPFDASSIENNNLARLYSAPRKMEDYHDRRKQNWHFHAAKMFAISDTEILTQDYISQLVVWRKDTLEHLTNYIQESHQRPWKEVLCGTLDFSEYTLYGIFAEHILKENSGHYSTPQELCYCSWHQDIKNHGELQTFLDSVPQNYKSVLIQSNLDIAPNVYLNQIHKLQEKQQTI